MKPRVSRKKEITKIRAELHDIETKRIIQRPIKSRAGPLKDKQNWLAFKQTHGGVGRYTLPPCTTKRRMTTNLKTKNNQNWNKVQLYGSPKPKKLKKKHSPDH